MMAKNAMSSNLAKNILLVGVITMFVKVVGFYKETLVSSNFGLSLLLYTYFIAFLIPGFIQNVFISSFKNVFIPNYVSELKTGSNVGALQATGFMITGLITLFFAIYYGC